jgi:Zn finger protein HypA/HybF involved in hydrogenase expression
MKKKKRHPLWSIDKDTLQNMFDTYSKRSDIIKKLNYSVDEGVYKILKKLTLHHNINLSKHMLLFKQEQAKRLNNIHQKINSNNFFSKNLKRNSSNVKKRLIKEKILENKCSWCGIKDTYNNKPIVLQLDHIDGDNKNNETSNLRLLCPNCHSQTDTFSGKNTKRKDKKYCKYCKIVVKTSNVCYLCKSLDQRKFNVSKEQLEKDINSMPMTKVGQKYGVSDNAIRKRCKMLKINIPSFPKGHWLKSSK